MAPCCLASSLAGLIAFNLPGIQGDVGSHLRTLWIEIFMVPISEGFDGGVAGGLRPMGGLRICVCGRTSGFHCNRDPPTYGSRIDKFEDLDGGITDGRTLE